MQGLFLLLVVVVVVLLLLLLQAHLLVPLTHRYLRL
jgi:hypothetical protein